jgi:hypothetical protein
MEQLFHIFRDNPNGRLEFIGSTQTLEASLELVKLTASKPTERFTIYNLRAHEITLLRADEVVDETSSSSRNPSRTVSSS